MRNSLPEDQLDQVQGSAAHGPESAFCVQLNDSDVLLVLAAGEFAL